MGGDFNFVLDNTVDRWPPKRLVSLNSAFKCFMDKFDQIDIWRMQFPDGRQYTWTNKDYSRRSRIDYWLLSRCLVNNNISVSISNSPLSDHKSISILINLSTSQSF